MEYMQEAPSVRTAPVSKTHQPRGEFCFAYPKSLVRENHTPATWWQT